MAGALPCAQFLRLARVFVVHDGVQFRDFVVRLAKEFSNEFGVFHSFLRLALIEPVGVGNGFAVGAQVRHKIKTALLSPTLSSLRKGREGEEPRDLFLQVA